jgi:hypothetical protein
MKRILATTAIVMLMAGGAYSAQMGNYTAQPQDVEASDFIGSRIYATNTMPTTDAVAVGAEKDWDDVGEINDVILGRDGQIKAVILGVGGFLGIGEKSVAIPMQDVKFVKNGDGAGDFFLVVNANKDVLTSAPAYVAIDARADMQQAAADAAKTANDAFAGAATTMGMTDANRTPLVRPQVTRDGYKAADENVGKINRLVLNANGQVERVVLDVGGFLGIGQRQIAVTMDELNIVRTDDGKEFRVFIDANQDNLKAQPEYKG